MIEIDVDDKKIIKALKELGKSEKSIDKGILSGVGTELKNIEKKNVYSYFTKRTGELKRLMTRSVRKDGSSVSVYSKAMNGKVKYGFVLANKYKDYLTPTAKEYENSDDMKKKIDDILNKYVDKAMK